MLVPLLAADEDLVLEHYLRLSAEDRILRFFSPMSDEAITSFVRDRLDFTNGVLFGILVDSALVGVAVVGEKYEHNDRWTAEAGFSIDNKFRGEGYATLLMAAIIGYCRGAHIQTLEMCCLRENRAMRRLAQNFGLKIVINGYEAYADLNIKDV